MWHMLVVLRRNLQNMKKSHRVADESMFGGANNGGEMGIFIDRRPSHGTWKGVSVIFSVVRAPLSLVSCFSQPHVNGTDGVWAASYEFSQMAEMNHLMVSDSMRYAIFM